MKVRFSIRNKILLAILSCGMIVGIITGTYLYFYTADATRREWSYFVSFTLEYLEREILSELHGVTDDLFIVRDDVNLHNMLEGASEIENEHFMNFTQKAFLSFAKNKKKYEQIRYIDESGKESVRINFDGQKAWVVPETELQVKKGRYYFDDTFDLDAGEIFISPLDLNIEKGEIEKPFKPMLRYGTPIFDSKGNKRGVVILNYLANTFLRCLQERQESLKDSKLMLLNKEGYFLLHPDSSMEWGFMLKNDKRLQKYYPAVISQLLTDKKGSVRSSGFEFDFIRIYPILELEKYIKAEGYYWILALQTPLSVIKAPLIGLLIRFVTLGTIFILVGFIIAFWVSSRLSRPIRELRNTIESFDINKIPINRARVSSKDEIEDLADSFNKMTEDLQRITVSRDILTHEIIERKKAEEELKESKGHLHLALSSAKMGTWRWDMTANQDTRDANFNHILGLEAKESTQPVEDFVQHIHPEDRVAVEEGIQRAIHGHGAYEAEFRIIRPDGTIHWLSDRGEVFYDQEERPIRMTGAVIDITERKKTEKGLKQKIEELEKFHKVAVGRELKMVELKERIKKLEKSTG